MKNNNPYQGYPYYYTPQQQGYAQQLTTGQRYKNQNSKTHLITGIVAGAAVAYLLTNKKVQQGISAAGGKAWSTVRGEVEELKERLEDTQAELEYYRNLHKESE
ncbi:MAG: cell shape-determining protein MreC [Moritella sp.]|jgi:cell shape-determining protein MreC